MESDSKLEVAGPKPFRMPTAAELLKNLEESRASIQAWIEKPRVVELPEDFPKFILSNVNDMRGEKTLCDVTITVGDKSFDAHKMVLAACSGYFKTMFTSGFKELSQSEVKIDGKGEIFKELLDFAYTGKMLLSPDTIFDLIDMAVYMEIKPAFEPIYEHLSFLINRSSLSFEVVLQLAILTENTYRDKWLLRMNTQCHHFLGNNLEKFASTVTFVNDVTADFFDTFLDGEMVVNGNSDRENKVLEAVVCWLKHDWEARHVHAYRLLKKVRLGLVSSEEINRLVDNQIRDVPECKNLADSILQILQKKKEEGVARSAMGKLDMKNPEEVMKFYSQQMMKQCLLPPEKPALSVTYPEMFAVRSTVTNLVSTGGKGNKKSGASFFIADYKNMMDWGWADFQNFDDLHRQKIHNHSTIFVNSNLYLAGGTAHKDIGDWRRLGKRECQKTFQCLTQWHDCYDWRHLCKMNVARKKFVMAYMDGFIYAIGGEGNNDFLDDVERYNMSSHQWEVQAPLLMKCIDMSVVVLDGKLLVYGCCGKMYIIQVFVPSENKWYQGSFNEKIPDNVKIKPAIIAHTGMCYRVIYPANDEKNSAVQSTTTSKPVVNHLQFNFADSDTVVAVGDAQDQDLVPVNEVGAFRINRDIFVNANGYIHKTDITIVDGQTCSVDLGPWVWLNHNCDKEQFESSHASVTCMTYDCHSQLTCITDDY